MYGICYWCHTTGRVASKAGPCCSGRRIDHSRGLGSVRAEEPAGDLFPALSGGSESSPSATTFPDGICTTVHARSQSSLTLTLLSPLRRNTLTAQRDMARGGTSDSAPRFLHPMRDHHYSYMVDGQSFSMHNGPRMRVREVLRTRFGDGLRPGHQLLWEDGITLTSRDYVIHVAGARFTTRLLAD